MEFHFSLIIPVYNRPNEVDELLNSLTKLDYKKNFEVIIVEDGSTIKSDNTILKYKNELNLQYFFKENSGAGESRNYGMQRALGNYFIIFDSDCLIPHWYLTEVEKALNLNYTDAFGGSDKAHDSFTNIQKAINFSMTSFFTTGGLRGHKKGIGKFQPRSFNMGISKKAFEITKGFSQMKIGEDIDLTFRLWEHNFETQFIENSFVYHKRRTSFSQFFEQTYRFGKGRPYLNRKYPKTAKLSYWFPTLFIAGFLLALLGLFAEIGLFMLLFEAYFLILFLISWYKNKSVIVAILSIFSTLIQFTGYGLGFIKGMVSKD